MHLTTYYFDKHFQEFLPEFEKYSPITRQTDSGCFLSESGQDILHCFYVKSGILQCSVLTEEGDELILSFHGPGSLIPVKCKVFHFTLETSFIIKTITPSVILELLPSDIEQIIRTCPDFAVAAIDFHTIYGNMYLNRAFIRSQKNAVNQLATFFYVYLYGYPAVDNQINLTQDSVASVLGISRVQVARAYQLLRDRNIIRSYRNGVQILDPEQLKTYASDLIVV